MRNTALLLHLCTRKRPLRQKTTPVLLLLQCSRLKKAPCAIKVYTHSLHASLAIITVTCSNWHQNLAKKPHSAFLFVGDRAKCQHVIYVTLTADRKLRMFPVSIGLKIDFWCILNISLTPIYSLQWQFWHLGWHFWLFMLQRHPPLVSPGPLGRIRKRMIKHSKYL